jgi:peptidylprolyl isomerase
MAKKNKEEYRLQNEKFLEDIAQTEGVKGLRGGVYYKVLEEGQGGGTVGPRSIVTCHYKGSLISGKVFDNSFSRSCPEAFRVNELISGFQIALVNMHIGDHWEVYVPSRLGYGPKNSGPIPGDSTLIFEIKLISVG